MRWTSRTMARHDSVAVGNALRRKSIRKMLFFTPQTSDFRLRRSGCRLRRRKCFVASCSGKSALLCVVLIVDAEGESASR